MNLQFRQQNAKTIDAVDSISYTWRQHTPMKMNTIVLVTNLLHLKKHRQIIASYYSCKIVY
jgi:hypothetical protein